MKTVHVYMYVYAVRYPSRSNATRPYDAATSKSFVHIENG